MSASEKDVFGKDPGSHQQTFFSHEAKPLTISFSWSGDLVYYLSVNPPFEAGKIQHIELYLYDNLVYSAIIPYSTSTANQQISLVLQNIKTGALVDRLRIKNLETAKNLKLCMVIFKEFSPVFSTYFRPEFKLDVSALQLGESWQLNISNVERNLSVDFVKFETLSAFPSPEK